MTEIRISQDFILGPTKQAVAGGAIVKTSLEAPLSEPGAFPRVGDEIGATLRQEHGATPLAPHPSAPHAHGPVTPAPSRHPAHMVRHAHTPGHRPQADPYTTLGPDDYRLTDRRPSGAMHHASIGGSTTSFGDSAIPLTGAAAAAGRSYAIGHMQPEFRNRLSAFLAGAKESGHSLAVFSGYRSQAHQNALFARSNRSGHWVARHSHHTMGIAADLRGDLGWAHAHAGEYGLHFPMSWERWHIEPTGRAPPQISLGGVATPMKEAEKKP